MCNLVSRWLILSFTGFGEAVKMPAVLSVFWMLCLMLRVDQVSTLSPSLSSCSPSLRVVDFHCSLHWNCSDINSNTNFMVQTKPLGGEWQNVSECVHISSSSCDLSHAFQNLHGNKFVRLLNHEHGATDWQGDCKFFPNPDARFSAPSVSVSLVGPKLFVDVALPCAPSVLCLNMGEPSCCPVSTLIILYSTVTVYNKHNRAETQNITFESDMSSVEFGMLTAGEEYCAVAQFASSPLSEPECVHVPIKGSLIIGALCGVIIALLLIGVCLLARRCASSETRLPKSLMSLQNVDQDSSSFVAESGQAALEEDEENHMVLLSIVPLHNNTYALSEPETQSACLSSQTNEDSYYASSILQHQAFDEQDGDTGSLVETDGDAPSDLCPGDLYASDLVVRTGPACLLEDCLTLGHLSIPLSSVKVAGAQREEMERDHLHEVLMNLKVVEESQMVADRDHGE